ncbi:MAG TPA: protein kinase [Planctomycetaceae bacterium]|jgi:predicted Ser/Thr protein kinase
MSEHKMTDEQRQQAADELVAEYLRRVEAGEIVDRDEFLRLHPEVANLLQAYFQGTDSMQRLKTEFSAAPSRGDETIAPRGAADSTRTPAGPFSILPRQFGRYRVEKLLGAGAMGAVYLAHDTQLARPVALKVPRLSGNEDNEIVGRLLREAKAAANLNHPNICRVYDAGVEAGTFYIAMEYIEGRLLSEFISPDRFQDERRCVNVTRKLAAALAEAHGKGIVHRDIKPANIIVNARGEPILTDFGLARLTDQPRDGRATQSGMLIGSPAYMSPEQADGDVAKIGPRSDIYGLGVLLFELLTSQLPFQGSVLTILSQIAGKEPPAPSSLRPGLDPRLDFICQRMMAKQPEDRFASMVEVGQELQNWLKAAPLIIAPPAAAAPAASALKSVTEEKAKGSKGELATPAEVAQRERGVQKLLDEQNYEAAIPLLVKLSELEGEIFKDTVAWATTTLPVARQKQQRLRERLTAALAKARTLMETYNYAEVAQMLDAIPAAARTAEVRELLTLAGERFEECLGLQQEIDAAIRGQTYERLLPLVKRFLKLKPDNSKMQRLARSLARNRADRAARDYKRTGKYFDVAGRLIEPKELVGGLVLIVGLVIGVSYGAKYLGNIRSDENMPPSNGSPDVLATGGSSQATEGSNGAKQAGQEKSVDSFDAKRQGTPSVIQTAQQTGKRVWAWSFDRQQAGRVPESSGSGFDVFLPKNAPADVSLASMTRGNTLEFNSGQIVEVDGVGDFGWKQPFSLAIWARASRNDNNHGVLIGKMNGAPTWRGYSLEFSHGVIAMTLMSDFSAAGGSSMIEVRTQKTVKADAWHHIVMTYDGTAKSEGIRLYVDGQSEPLQVRNDRLTADIHNDVQLTIGARFGDKYFSGWLAEPRLYEGALSPDDVVREFERAPKPESLPAAAVDVLAQGTLPVTGGWTIQRDRIISPAAPSAILQLPYHVPEEYVVSLLVRRISGNNTFAIGVPVAGQQVLIALDAHESSLCGLEYLDGKTINDNEATHRGGVFVANQDAQISCTIRKDGVACTIDGKRIIDWRGDPKRLSLPQGFVPPDPQAPFLATIGSSYEIRKLTLSPLSKDGGRIIAVSSAQDEPSADSADVLSSGDKIDLVDGRTKPVLGSWQIQQGRIVSPLDNPALLQFPVHVPADYVVSLRVRRTSGNNTFAIGLPVGGSQVLVALDAHESRVSGLEVLDGRAVNDNETTYKKGKLFVKDKEAKITCTVRRDRIMCTFNGVKVVDWKGDSNRLAIPSNFTVPDRRAIFLGTMGSGYEIRQMTVSVP